MKTILLLQLTASAAFFIGATILFGLAIAEVCK